METIGGVMRIGVIAFFSFALLVVVGCRQILQENGSSQDGLSLTHAAAETATAMMDVVKNEFFSGLTRTAAVDKAVEEALTTAVAEAVAQTLTAVLPEPTESRSPTESPTNNPPGSSTPFPSETPTMLLTSTQLLQPTATRSQTCYVVIDSWCNSHKGCSTVQVRNHSGLDSSWHIWSYNIPVDTSIIIPPGHCTIVTRPGKYNFHVTYCDGEVADFSWQLNDKWYYKISPCE
jgi:hypothetical protein